MLSRSMMIALPIVLAVLLSDLNFRKNYLSTMDLLLLASCSLSQTFFCKFLLGIVLSLSLSYFTADYLLKKQ